MDVREAIEKRRTIRRFIQKPIPYGDLKALVDAARLAPSGGNLQPWEFIIVDDPEIVSSVFPCLAWAGYLAPKGTPEETERPVAYIVVLSNKKIASVTPAADIAAAIENLILRAVEMGIGSCWIGSVRRDSLAALLKIPETHSLEYVVALGYPKEVACIEEMTDSVKYWRDNNGVHHVPKRRLDSILHRNVFRGALDKSCKGV